MSDLPELLDATPRRRSGMGRSPLRQPPPAPRRGVIDALAEHHAWMEATGHQWKQPPVRQRRVVEPAPEPVAPPPEVLTQATPEVVDTTEVVVEVQPQAPPIAQAALADDPMAALKASLAALQALPTTT